MVLHFPIINEFVEFPNNQQEELQVAGVLQLGFLRENAI
jgi:hypothetical protein